MKGGSGGGFTFSQVPQAVIPRSSFNRTHGHKTTFDADYLIPWFVDEVLPGDTFKVSGTLFARLATPVNPVMDNLYLDVFWFFVPNRLLWSNWQKFMGEQANPADSTDFQVPVVTSFIPAAQSLWDYFGLPTEAGRPIVPIALFSRAYNRIWNEWFRDENLQNSVTVDLGDGPDANANYVLLKRGKRHDYFTSCLPWPQKGVGVNLPLGGYARVLSNEGLTIPGSSPSRTGTGQPRFAQATPGYTNSVPFHAAGATTWQVGSGANTASNSKWATMTWPDPAGSEGPALVADLSSATSVTINTMRQAFQIQKLMERDARGGTRYVEILRSHFGVVSPDARLQRSEFLGGGTVRVIVNPVTQTSATNAQPTPKGSLGAYGVAGGSQGFSKSFVEHGVLLGLVSARADLSYQQGFPKMFSRRSKYEFYWPALAHLGEQAVTNKEIYYQNTAADADVFGYQERWAEYRYYPSKITGKFRSTYATPLDSWHLAEKFLALPTLGSTFIQSNTPMTRVIAVATEPHFILDSLITMVCTRPMPVYSVPGLIDHF